MLNEAENIIVNVLRKSVKDVPENNISVGKIDLSIEGKLPSISITNIDFRIEEVGIGRTAVIRSSEVKEYFSGDGKNVSYILGRKPLKPILSLEHPPGKRKLENIDYIVDYKTGLINFKSPPEKGLNNILVKYLIPVETKSFKLNMRYHINVLSGDETQTNNICFNIVKTFLEKEEELNLRGIIIKPIGGFSIPAEKLPKGVYGKIIECILETYLYIEIQLPIIEKVEVGKREI